MHFQIRFKLLGLFSFYRYNRLVPSDDEDIHIAIGPDSYVGHGVQIDDDIFGGTDEFAHLRLDVVTAGWGKQALQFST